ncbi:aminoglycoside 6-adenylyltransferase [Bdellovibrio sp. HCB209]|uniref:aminoglycoside 6-adenylyltransferase n=1 Tax=Bdellovibrio sp. HCB209 TaxID=3394354 RepID=UPI0039B54851
MDELQTFLNNTIEILKKDDRILGIAVAGSWITKNTDRFSDLDLVIVCEDTSYDSMLATRELIAKSLGDFLVGFTGEHVGEPRLLIALYDNPILHVDLKFIKLADLEARIEDPVIAWERSGLLTAQMSKSSAKHPMPNLQWIEDRFWVWIHYGATKLGRGELFQVIDLLTFLRTETLGSLSLVKHGNLPRGSRRLEFLAKEDLEDFKKTVPAYDKQSCAMALEASINLYRKLRDQMDDGKLLRRDRAEFASTKYLKDVLAEKI